MCKEGGRCSQDSTYLSLDCCRKVGLGPLELTGDHCLVQSTEADGWHRIPESKLRELAKVCFTAIAVDLVKT